MKKFLLSCALFALSASTVSAQQYAEQLERGGVAITNGRGGMYLSWRQLVSDDPNLTFDVYRNGTKVNSTPISTTTTYADTKGNVSSVYTVKAMLGEEVKEEFSLSTWTPSQKVALNLPPAGVTPSGEEYTYTPNDCSVGDVDGDGEYELIVKWYPSNAKDNSQSGYTGNTILDCYELDGTQLWRVDLGINIRSGAHYTQFMVYDFDGDGKAEMICKTGPGSIDATGAYVNAVATDPTIAAASNTKDWRNSNGRVNGGQEWLTVFDGLTGAAIHTIYYNPNRNTTVGGDAAGTFNWGDNGKNDKGDYGNRGERYLACVAYLDGPDATPSAVMVRGYYTYAFLWAVDFDGKELKHRWLHSSKSTTSYTVTDADGNVKTYTPGATTRGSGSRTAYGNGNHNISLADVDNDGKDEVIWGACAIDDDGTLLYSTGYGHGDAIHVGKMIPEREGLQVYDIHESSPYGWDIHDAATGEILFSGTADGDTGRGIAADIDPNNYGYEMWCSADRNPRKASTGTRANSTSPSMNFRIYWDGDLQDELLDGSKITKYDAASSSITTLATLSGSSCNSTKATPCLQADILGDWREEVILWDSNDPSQIYIHSSTIATTYKEPCLMQDHTYRMAICWQNVAYNQPPHLGYYLPDGMPTSSVTDIITAPGEVKAVYSATTGMKVSLNSAAPGVYITVDSNGATRKIMK